MFLRVASLVLAVAAICAPTTLAVPAYARPPAINDRALQSRQESGALNWNDVKGFGSDVLHGAEQALPVVKEGYDLYKDIKGKRNTVPQKQRLTAPAAHILDARDIHHIERDSVDLIVRRFINSVVARQAQDEESGALDWKKIGTSILHGAETAVQVAAPIALGFLRREPDLA
ncbi:hypothetical protein EIP91_009420 [Steccherinum ochraceum]|uniref:Uncharacterized protein n=1 Tax=Steccherinum ochraceum TaxID=92696 RepID=A0A4R0R1M9_9APHY|nr:hypothetical protein EIP91_009420 [Steccherinum ochraceum]